MIKKENFFSVEGIILQQLGGFRDKENSMPYTLKIMDELKAYIKHNSHATSQCVIAIIDDELCFGRVDEGI